MMHLVCDSVKLGKPLTNTDTPAITIVEPKKISDVGAAGTLRADAFYSV